MYDVFDKDIELMLPNMKITKLDLVCVEERRKKKPDTFQQVLMNPVVRQPYQDNIYTVSVWNCTYFLVAGVIHKLTKTFEIK